MLHKGLGGMSGVGVTAAVAFIIATLQLQGKDASTTWLWLGIIICLAVGVLAGIGWMLTGGKSPRGGAARNARADRRGTAIAGNVQTLIQQSGGTMIIGGQPSPLPTESDSPVLELGEPECVQVPIYEIGPAGARQIDTVDLWRVAVTNVVKATKATDVSVRLESITPSLPYGKIKLHRTGDDVWPYEKQFSLRFDEPVLLDVIAKSPTTDAIYLWRSDQPSYAFAISGSEKRRFIDHFKRSAASLTLRAIADPPVASLTQDYVLYIDVDGRLVMEKAKRP